MALLRFATPPLAVQVEVAPELDDALPTALRCFPPADAGPAEVTFRAGPDGDGWALDDSSGPTLRTRTAPELVAALVSRLNLLHLTHDTTRTHVHAGGVVHADAAVLVVGHSGAGKSTLVAHLLDRGGAYLGDEMVGVDPGGLVHGYPKPLTLKTGSRAVVDHVAHDLGLHTDLADGQRWEVAPDALGVVADTGQGWRAGLLAFTLWDDGAEAPLVSEPLDPADALVALGANSLDLERDPELGLAALGRLATAPAHRVRHRDGAAVADWALARVADPAPPVAVEVLPTAEADLARAGEGLLRRVAPSVVVAGRAVVWDGRKSRLMTLNPEGTALWAGLGDRPARDLLDDGPDDPLEVANFLARLTREGLVAGWTS